MLCQLTKRVFIAPDVNTIRPMTERRCRNGDTNFIFSYANDFKIYFIGVGLDVGFRCQE